MAAILPQGKATFCDANNLPLVGGSVYFYVPSTTTTKTTWADSAKATPNANPIVLDSHGQATIWGEGQYRQIVMSAAGVTVWDQVVAAESTSAAMLPVVSASTLAAARTALGVTTSSDTRVFLPESYGAVGDGVTDDTAACQSAINAAVAVGGVVQVSRWYKITGSGLVIDQSALATLTSRLRVSIQGNGPGVCGFVYTGAGQCLTYTGSTAGSGAGASAFIEIEKLQIYGPGTGGATYGLSISKAAYFAIRDVFIWNFNTGIGGSDTLSWLMERATLIWNAKGMALGMGAFSAPNAISLVACTIGLNSSYGALVQNCDTFTMHGGSVESNGSMSSGYGVQISSPGDNGAGGASFFGVHFEGNAKDADILVNANSTAANLASISAFGCSFSRVGSTTYATNNIQVNNSAGFAPVRLGVFGCGFRGFGTYVANAARPYIGINAGGGTIWLTEFGNGYGSATEAPKSSTVGGPWASPSGTLSARASFGWSGAAIVTSDERNVSSITRSGTGVYVVAFRSTMADGGYSVAPGMTTAGFITPSLIATTGFTLTCLNSAGAAVDPTNVFFQISGGGNY